MSNKAGYTATKVACGWAGAVTERANQVFGQVQLCKNRPKTPNKAKRERRTDGPTDRAGYEVACMRLKRGYFFLS